MGRWSIYIAAVKTFTNKNAVSASTHGEATGSHNKTYMLSNSLKLRRRAFVDVRVNECRYVKLTFFFMIINDLFMAKKENQRLTSYISPNLRLQAPSISLSTTFHKSLLLKEWRLCECVYFCFVFVVVFCCCFLF